MNHDPNIVAQMAASLLRNRDLDVGEHHAKEAVAAARRILDAAHAPDPAAEPSAEA
jgi:hypothetical protein